jgi:formamidopyrimidine-DNA glycosylase
LPELPEVETIVRGLRLPLKDRTISGVEVLRPDLLLDTPGEFVRALEGGVFTRVDRRGKNVVLEVMHPPAAPGASVPSARGSLLFLVVNLGMSGRLILRPRGDRTLPPSHPGVRICLENGGVLVYHDIRRFGRLSLLEPAAFVGWTGSLGPEPLSRRFTGAAFTGSLARSGSPIRSWLLDQRNIAGIGNIYANEALFLSRIHPRTPANRVDGEAGTHLHRSIRSVLHEAIRSGGTTLRDYRTAQGEEGSYRSSLRVYGREGRPCLRCGVLVERLVFGGRSAFLCPGCQPRIGR